MSVIVTTVSGKSIDLENLSVNDIDWSDISHSLSRIPRFNGHCRLNWTVAHHSLLCENLAIDSGATSEQALACLIHDFPEAYIGDLIRPVKKMNGGMADYEDLEDKIFKVIMAKAGLREYDYFFVKGIDLRALEIEEAAFRTQGLRDLVKIDLATDARLHLKNAIITSLARRRS